MLYYMEGGDSNPAPGVFCDGPRAATPEQEHMEYILASYEEAPAREALPSGDVYFVSGGKLLIPQAVPQGKEDTGDPGDQQLWVEPMQELVPAVLLTEPDFVPPDLVSGAYDADALGVTEAPGPHMGWVRHKNLVARNEGLVMDTCPECAAPDMSRVAAAQPAAPGSRYRFIPSPDMGGGALVRQAGPQMGL